jgi:hypothetical protein
VFVVDATIKICTKLLQQHQQQQLLPLLTHILDENKN